MLAKYNKASPTPRCISSHFNGAAKNRTVLQAFGLSRSIKWKNEQFTWKCTMKFKLQPYAIVRAKQTLICLTKRVALWWKSRSQNTFCFPILFKRKKTRQFQQVLAWTKKIFSIKSQGCPKETCWGWWWIKTKNATHQRLQLFKFFRRTDEKAWR